MRIERAIEEYPFIRNILDMQLKPSEEPIGKPSEIHVHVQTADGDLMFHKPSIYGIGEDSCIYIAGKRGKSAQALRQCEYIFATDKTEIVNDRRWPKNYVERMVIDDFYASEILFDANADAPLWNCVEYLVLMCIKVYYEHDKDLTNKCGAALRRVVDITVYKKPEIGFKRLYAESALSDHVYMNDSVLYKAMNENNLDIIRLVGRLDEICERFQTHVYAHGLKDIIDRNGNAAISGQFGPVNIYYSSMRGGGIEIRNSLVWILLVVSKNGEKLEVASESGTIPQIRNMVDGVIIEWENDPQSHKSMQPITG